MTERRRPPSRPEAWTALVTGASRGIGAAIAKRLAAEGARVVVHYGASRDEAAAVADECRRAGARGVAVKQADVRSGEALSALKAELAQTGWLPSVVVHSAGTAYYGMLDETDEATWDDLFQVHLKAAYRLARLFAPQMSWDRWGRFVHVSSVWGVVGAAGEVAYSAAKGGLNSFTKGLAKELGPFGVTANAIAPGIVETDMLGAFEPGEREALLADMPLGRFAAPAEVAELAAFLVSDRAGYITGQVIGLTGGWRL